MLEQELKGGSWTPKARILSLHPEPVQANIVIGFDVPERKRAAAEGLLEAAAEVARRAVESAFGERLATLGATIEDLRVDWD